MESPASSTRWAFWSRRSRMASVIARPAAEDVIGWIDLFLQGRRLDTSVLLEVREIIEPWCAGFAAERRTDDDLRELDARNSYMLEVIDDLEAYLQANVAWHMAVADASHNELLAALMHALSKAVLRQTGGEHFNTVQVRATAVHAHSHVIHAIRAGDADAARRRMARHVHAFATMLLRSEH
jgi:GntR family transcriptional regulator, transcriptional repressor for pyruvate dehydrogenase complex